MVGASPNSPAREHGVGTDQLAAPGNKMDQNRNGANGEPTDSFKSAFVSSKSSIAGATGPLLSAAIPSQCQSTIEIGTLDTSSNVADTLHNRRQHVST
jgi:hypothetical protein